MSAATLEDMVIERASRTNPWDRRSSGKAVSEVDEGVLYKYVERGVKRNRIPFEYTNARDVLSRLGLLHNDGMLTNAAAICFVPSRDVMLRMGVFADSKRVDILDNQQVAGTLFSMVEAAELYILNNIRRAFIIDGSSLHREERPEIPRSAIREALFNAFCHRRYEDEAAIQVDIFWNCVDIYSPGIFPSGLSPDDYLSGEVAASKPRNQLIAATLYKSGDIETYGTGIRRIKAVCDEQGVPVKMFMQGGSVHVRFTRSEGVSADSPTSAESSTKSSEEFRSGSEEFRSGSEELPSNLSKSELAAYKFIAENGASRTAAIAKAIGLSPRGTFKLLKRLENKNLITSQGSTSDRTYRLS